MRATSLCTWGLETDGTQACETSLCAHWAILPAQNRTILKAMLNSDARGSFMHQNNQNTSTYSLQLIQTLEDLEISKY